jgi:signal transduction histidine kinase
VDFAPGEHLCVVYEDPAHWLATAVPYIAEGLARGERCVYTAPHEAVAALYAGLAEAGVDVERERRRGTLSFPSERETYLRLGHFDPDAMLAFWRDLVDETERLGYAGCRLGGSPVWALDGRAATCDKLVEYEVRINELFRRGRSRGLCQYDRRRFPPAVIRDVLRAHPIAVLGLDRCHNPYYEEPDIALRGPSAAKQADRMIAHMRRTRALEVEHAQALQRERALRAQAEAANRAKDELLAVVSHELRTPLNAIIGWVKMMRSSVADPAIHQRGIEVIERNAEAQAQLVSDLLDVSRMTAGRLRIDVRPTDLVSVVEVALDTVRPAAAAKGIRLSAALDHDRPCVTGDPVRLQQVVLKLLSNAVEFTDAGGAIDVRVLARDGRVELVVADTGQGIEAVELPLIFERFRQIDGSAARAHTGLGLGLAIAKSLVELHGGMLRAESGGRGCGATFTVSLPLADDPGAHPGEHRPVRQSSDAAV